MRTYTHLTATHIHLIHTNLYRSYHYLPAVPILTLEGYEPASSDGNKKYQELLSLSVMPRKTLMQLKDFMKI